METLEETGIFRHLKKIEDEYQEWGVNLKGRMASSAAEDPSQKRESEIDAEVTRLNEAEPMRLLRLERDRLLAACDWRASSDLTLSDSWKTYRQALRDLPVSASPKLDSNGDLDMTSVTFPTEPN